ncbi:GntR family transcriptional regulator [Pseudorhodoferax sp.]|uniref:GntR family transcriptional regulator n=1 Tax=Pseudorhodoferax sp. TaxID=1993553 RepID=UPI002DD69D90|nr:GntR family transcriptional regulator [Pseudorhodoferax sp.]
MLTSSAPPQRIEKTPGTALHRQLFLVLREQILRGVYAPGALLPNEDELCRHFGVSKITVRRALSDLKQQGLLERHQGRGTFVGAQLQQARGLEAMSFLDALKARGRQTQVRVLEVQTVVPPGAVALQLQIPSGTAAVYAARLRHLGSTDLIVTEAWVPLDLGRGVTAAQLKRRPLYEILQAQGVAFGRVIEEITAVAATPLLAKLLHTELGVPLLRLTRLMYDQEERPVEHLTVHMNPEHSRVLLNLPPTEIGQGVASRIVHDVAAP